jgi:hypothetical protein
MAIGGGKWSISRPGNFTNNKRACSVHRVGGWREHSFGLNSLEKRNIHLLSENITAVPVSSSHGLFTVITEVFRGIETNKYNAAYFFFAMIINLRILKFEF